MEASNVVSDGGSCDSSLTESIATASVLRRALQGNERSNKVMLQQFMGVRPVRRHTSMRNKCKSAQSEIEHRMEEEDSIVSNSSIAAYAEEMREAPEDATNASVDNDDWSTGCVRSPPYAVALPGKEQQYPIKSPLIVQSSKSSLSSIHASSVRKRRFASIASKLACLTCATGVSRHKEDELDEVLPCDSNTSEDESEKSARPQTNEDKVPSLFAMFESYFHMNFNANEIDYTTNPNDNSADHHRQRFSGMECVAPCDDISLDSDAYEFSIGSFTDEQSIRTSF